MKSFDLFRRWLVFVFALQAGFGLLLALFGPQFLLGQMYNSYLEALIHRPDLPSQFLFFHRWVFAVIGSTIASWAVAMAFVTFYPFARRERWAWTCVFLSLIVWFPLDTSASAVFKVWPNVYVNVALMLSILIPLLATRKEFTATK